MKILQLFLLSLLLSSGLRAAPTDVFVVGGAVVKPGEWTAAKLETDLKADVKTVTYTVKDVKHTARAVPLAKLLAAATVKTNPNIKNHAMQFVVTVRGRDGYAVAFSLPELLPEIGKRAVWVAFEEDGKPLSEHDGPVQILSLDDAKPARWVHSVVNITVVDEAAAH